MAQGNPLRIVSPYSVYSGYAGMGRSLLRTAILAGYNVSAIESDLRVRVTRWAEGRTTFEPHLPVPHIPLPPMQEPELRERQKVYASDGCPTILVQTPWNLGNWPQYGAGPIIGYTMTESDNLCAYWRHGLRNVDMAVAPSSFVYDTFRAKTPDVPAALMPIPVDERPWTYDDSKAEMQEHPPFLFLSIFSVCERKAWRPLMVAFAEEFRTESREVGLIVKGTPPEPIEQLASNCREMGAWVQTDWEKRNWWSLAALYRSCQVYVCPASEGFGLPIVEAAYCGLPSVALDKGGAADVVDEEVGYVCPSFMAPIIGHMPQYYDRKTDNFACFDIDEMRRTLRRAYEEERSGRGKSEAAKERAMARYRPEVLAPRLREVVELGVQVHSEALRTTAHPVKPRWATLAGAWGDVFCAIGNIREMMQTKEIEKIGLVFYGRDAKIADWLRDQPWVREVLSIVQPDKKTMTLTYGKLCQVKPQYAHPVWMDLTTEAGAAIREDEIAFTQLCLSESRQPRYWTGAVLPREARDWADNVSSCVTGDFLLVNPLSVASNTMQDHWPHWGPSLQWLVDNANVPVILVGENLIEWQAHPNLINVSGASRSMMDVLALAEKAAGIITTGNNLGHYSIIAGKPAVVAFARTCPKQSFYHKFNEHPLLSLVEFEEPACDFQRAVMERFPHLMRSEEPVPPVLVEKPHTNGNGKHKPTDADRMTEKEFYGLGRA
jgi:glycosyltransferase involved in cell wall biosynthesis